MIDSRFADRSFARLLSVLLLCLYSQAYGQVLEKDSLALVDLYNSTNGPNWTINAAWLTTEPVEYWVEVSVFEGRVVELNLHRNNLTGTLPESIGDLTALNSLDLSFNNLSGTIPSSIGNLTLLERLNLDQNSLEGPIPNSIGNLAVLPKLLLAHNRLTGAIPEEIGNLAQLSVLGLTYNELSGSIPRSIGNLTNLQELRLSNNQLTGPIPEEIGNLTRLFRLSLNTNRISGTIPAEIGHLTGLENLWLGQNQLTGAVPTEIANLGRVRGLWLNDNQLSDLPVLCSMNSLIFLYLQNNRFTFEDIEPNISCISFVHYAPQDSLGVEQDTSLYINESLTLNVSTGGLPNQYRWLHNGAPISGADDSVYTLHVSSLADSGTYLCRITNTLVTELTLYSRPVRVNVVGTMATSEREVISAIFALHSAYPNPFNPSTMLRFELPKGSYVSLGVYNLSGQKVASLVDNHLGPGYHQIVWNGKSETGREVPSGIYIARLVTPPYTKSIKMLLLK